MIQNRFRMRMAQKVLKRKLELKRQAAVNAKVRSPENGNTIFGIKYCRNLPEIATITIIYCAYLCSCGFKHH